MLRMATSTAETHKHYSSSTSRTSTVPGIIPYVVSTRVRRPTNQQLWRKAPAGQLGLACQAHQTCRATYGYSRTMQARMASSSWGQHASPVMSD